MRVLFDQCTPKGLRNYLPEHEVRTAKEEGLDRVRNGELIKTAVDKGFEVLITADKRMRKKEAISGLPIRVVVLTRPYWRTVKTQVRKIQKAVREAEPGRFTTVQRSAQPPKGAPARATGAAEKTGTQARSNTHQQR